jgi:hypothetical protein
MTLGREVRDPAGPEGYSLPSWPLSFWPWHLRRDLDHDPGFQKLWLSAATTIAWMVPVTSLP